MFVLNVMEMVAQKSMEIVTIAIIQDWLHVCIAMEMVDIIQMVIVVFVVVLE